MYWVGTRDSLQNYKKNVAHFVELKKVETCRSIIKFLDGPSLPNKRFFSFGKIPQSNPFSYNSGPQQAWSIIYDLYLQPDKFQNPYKS